MIAIVLAMTKKGRVIGKDGKMPWDIPDELNHFRALTKNSVVVMGRKTYDSIGHPLPNRQNIVVSRNVSEIEGCEVATSVSEAVAKAKKYGKDIFIIGGASLIEESFGVADTMLLSFIKKEYDGDTFFPQWDAKMWKIVKKEEHDGWEFVMFKKK